MAETHTQAPEASEYAAFYHRYIAALPDRPALEQLEEQLPETLGLWAAAGEGARRAPLRAQVSGASRRWPATSSTWSGITWPTRALRIARGDATPLPGFEED